MAKKKEIDVISTHVDDPVKLDGYKPWLGREVISKSGDSVGYIRDILYTDDKMMGVMVSKGFSKSFIDKEYFGTNNKDCLMLTIDPFSQIRGKLVFDADGRKMGKIKEVVRKDRSNSFTGILVKKSIFSKPVEIPHGEIAVCKKNVILNKVYE